MKITLVHRLLVIALYTIFVLGVLLLITGPIWLDEYLMVLFGITWLAPNYRAFIVPFMEAGGIIGMWIVFELIGMLRTVPTHPFIWKNVKALRRIGIAGVAASLMFLVKCFFFMTPLTVGCGVLLLICSLGAFTLSDLFRQAVIFKEENDLTI